MSENDRGVWLVTQAEDEAFERVFGTHQTVEAAGGIVLNPHGELLLIHRLGHWDLPKGKMEPGETQEISAIREVEEETGVTGLSIVGSPLTTYHTYHRNGRDVIKPTYWFLMRAEKQELVPQEEEDISQAEWVPMDRAKELLRTGYPSLAELSELFDLNSFT